MATASPTLRHVTFKADDGESSEAQLSKGLSETSLETEDRKAYLLDRLSGTYMIDSRKQILLHGYLRIQIIRAESLRNLDCCGAWACTNSACCQVVTGGVSDPYVTVHAGFHRLLKTRTIQNKLNPEWQQEFFVPVADYIDALEFRVKDLDLNITVDVLGRAYLPVEDIVKLDASDQPIRTGIHRVVNLDDKPRHGTLEYAVEFVPAHYMVQNFAVPATYFEPHLDSCDARFYINADASPDRLAVDGPPNGVQGPARCWRDIYDSMCAAKHFIYVAGWSVDHKQSLLRGEEKEQALRTGIYSPNIGELLKKKAEEGVTVNILVWDDRTSNVLHHNGVMGTYDEDLRQFCANTKINLCLAPIIGGHYNPFVGMRNAITCTHHQKMVVCDEGKSLVGYVGGIDLTNGRYETNAYPLFRSLATAHAGDFYNGCATIIHKGATGPRQPWHDIHSRLLHGPGVLDLIKNFEERWRRQAAAHQLSALIDSSKLKHADEPKKYPWSCQLFRSIDGRTANFELSGVSSWTKAFDATEGVTFLRQEKVPRLKKRNKVLLKDPRPVYERRFESESIDGFDFHSKLMHNRGIETDTSAHLALVHHIRRAEHAIYIENQYFLSSSHMWKDHHTVKCGNLVAAEIALKICQKIEADERFAVYIVLPMWSEGIPESSAVQEILYWQYLTIDGMYTAIASAIARKKDRDPSFDSKPSDYLNFYCLGNRETDSGSEAVITPRSGSQAATLRKTRRHLVYVHSKMTIVDDAVALIGSANINQRSLDGNRDSELIMGYWQQEYLADRQSVAHGDIHAFRLQCWNHTTGIMDNVFRDPSSLACVQRVNEIAEANWKLYTQDEPCEMTSYLMPYPISVGSDGKVQARTSDGHFPDTKAKILGNDSFLPDFLTT